MQARAARDATQESLSSERRESERLRAYAKALGVDDEVVIARFRADHGQAAEPLREPIDLDQSDEAVMAVAEALARSRPKFRSRTQWITEMQALMGYKA